jgi:signal transduction histidine kinase/ActR/RegA family two-component response regulator
MRQRTRPGLLPVVVAVTSIAVAILVAIVVHGVVRNQERQLLRERGAELALTLQSSIDNLQASLPVLARVARLDRSPGKREFTQAARQAVTVGVGAVGAGDPAGRAPRVVAAAGNGPRAGTTLRGAAAAVIRRAAASPKLVTAFIRDAGGDHLLIAARGQVYVAYEESPVDPARPVPDTPSSPYNDLAVALYASPRRDPAKLVITTTGKAPTGGSIDTRMLPVGADRWLLLTSAKTPLVGQFATNLPWIILGIGLLISLLLTTLVTVLVRRRGYALAAVETRTAELREARALAEDANQAKSEFLSRMSHELRTPLNAVLGFGQVLELDGLDADQQESVDHIMKGGRHLLGLVDEILDISRIESGTMTISVEPVEVASALGDVLRLVGPLAAESGIELTSELPPADEAYVLADRLRLRQVLLNLLSNGVKYNHAGGWVRVTVAPVADHRLEIRVTDSGHGIPEDKLALLFTPFERLGAELGHIEGTGLGLALSKGLVERMGGSIRAENSVDGGATFAVALQQVDSAVSPGALETARVTGEAQPQFGACTMLYIEDNLSNFQLIERVLAPQLQVRLLPAMQGGLGMELAERHHPDLILLDLHLPDIPGPVLFDRLRANPRTCDIPIVVVSADATDGQVKRLLDSGADDYLTKPLDLRRFLEIVRRHARVVDDPAARAL